MALLPVFVITLLVTLALFAALYFGRVPTYRPTRDQIVELLEGVTDGSADTRKWDLFLGVSIRHDALLENTRVQCVTFHEGLDGAAPAREGLDGAIYDREGREQIKKILEQLKTAMQNEPIIREF